MTFSFPGIIDECGPSVLKYQARRHAYQRTDEYLFSQLIPYIGNKRKLLGLIDKAVRKTGVSGGVFADLFAGSGVVSRYAKYAGFQVVANDWEPYSNVLNSASVALNEAPCSNDLFEHLNSLPGIDGYIATNYCPANDDSPNASTERMYYTRANGRKIDAIRTEIFRLAACGSIDKRSQDYLLAPLISASSYTSNTSGVFKAYHNGWGGQTGTALYRILSDIKIKPVKLFNNSLSNMSLSMDAADLASSWRDLVGTPASIVYLDPPYNQHPYGSNYHLLNSIALWDCPDVPDILQAKSAIRTDWRSERRSHYNTSALALPALTRLVELINCRWILMSYSTDGNISVPDLVSSMAKRGAVSVVANSYKRYRVSAQRMSDRSHNVEFVLILDKLGACGDGQDEALQQINSAIRPV